MAFSSMRSRIVNAAWASPARASGRMSVTHSSSRSSARTMASGSMRHRATSRINISTRRTWRAFQFAHTLTACSTASRPQTNIPTDTAAKSTVISVSRILEPTSERRVIPRFEIGMLPHFLLRGGVLPVEEVVDVGKPHRDYRCDNPNREVDELTGDGREQGYGSTGPS